MKEKKKLTIGGIFSQIVLLILAVIVLYPLVFMFLTSVKSNLDVLTNPLALRPLNRKTMFLHGKLVKLEAFS